VGELKGLPGPREPTPYTPSTATLSKTQSKYGWRVAKATVQKAEGRYNKGYLKGLPGPKDPPITLWSRQQATATLKAMTGQEEEPADGDHLRDMDIEEKYGPEALKAFQEGRMEDFKAIVREKGAPSTPASSPPATPRRQPGAFTQIKEGIQRLKQESKTEQETLAGLEDGSLVFDDDGEIVPSPDKSTRRQLDFRSKAADANLGSDADLYVDEEEKKFPLDKMIPLYKKRAKKNNPYYMSKDRLIHVARKLKIQVKSSMNVAQIVDAIANTRDGAAMMQYGVLHSRTFSGKGQAGTGLTPVGGGLTPVGGGGGPRVLSSGMYRGSSKPYDSLHW
jgi:hypothetical protein